MLTELLAEEVTIKQIQNNAKITAALKIELSFNNKESFTSNINIKSPPAEDKIKKNEEMF